jgi:hypothetical protein
MDKQLIDSFTEEQEVIAKSIWNTAISKAIEKIAGLADHELWGTNIETLRNILIDKIEGLKLL